jgi:transcription initiation factor IIF auxiliary subunit
MKNVGNLQHFFPVIQFLRKQAFLSVEEIISNTFSKMQFKLHSIYYTWQCKAVDIAVRLGSVFS